MMGISHPAKSTMARTPGWPYTGTRDNRVLTVRWRKVIMDDRKLEVLRAIVEDYVATREPVGSKALAERHNFGVSSATLRNDMAMLEEEGYIVAPHTSAGRVPTDKGYRLFVDRIAQIKPLSPAERRAIHHFLDAAVDLDDVMQRTVRLLAQLTQQVALVQYPTLTRSGVRHVEIVGLTSRRVLLVVIADTGRVEQRTVESPIDVTDEALLDLRARLNGAVVEYGKQLGVHTPINALFTDVLLDLVRRPSNWPLWQSGAMRLLAAAEEYRDMAPA